MVSKDLPQYTEATAAIQKQSRIFMLCSIAPLGRTHSIHTTEEDNKLLLIAFQSCTNWDYHGERCENYERNYDMPFDRDAKIADGIAKRGTRTTNDRRKNFKGKSFRTKTCLPNDINVARLARKRFDFIIFPFRCDRKSVIFFEFG